MLIIVNFFDIKQFNKGKIIYMIYTEYIKRCEVKKGGLTW